MSFFEYLKDRLFSVIIHIILIVFVIFFLITFKVNTFLIVYIPIFIIIAYLSVFLYDFFIKRNYYNRVISNLNGLDKKYLIQEIIEQPEFLEGKIFYDSVHEINKSMLENVNYYSNNEKEFREYIEMWVHEIKTPIASTKLIVENNLSEVTRNIDEELDKIDNYIEQVLYYSRSDNVHKDYIIKEVLLENVVNKVILNNKKDFITKKIKLDIYDLNITVNSDSKWLEYILKQIVANSIKYSKIEQPKISIYALKYNQKVELIIEDNGIGIEQKDLNKVFEKGFTGENGRKIYKSTGMGLYLCKKLCEKLGHDISIFSNENDGTNLRITFPLGSHSKFE